MIAMSAIAHTISSSEKPVWPASFIPGTRHGVQRDIGGSAAAALPAIRAERHDVVGTALAGSAIDIGMVPWIGGDSAAPQVRPVPGVDPWRAANQRRKPLRRRRITAGVEIEQIQRAGEALQLDLCRLDLRLA